MEAKLFGLNRIMLSMSKRSEYGELLNARFRLALIADALGLPNLDEADTENATFFMLIVCFSSGELSVIFNWSGLCVFYTETSI